MGIRAFHACFFGPAVIVLPESLMFVFLLFVKTARHEKLCLGGFKFISIFDTL